MPHRDLALPASTEMAPKSCATFWTPRIHKAWVDAVEEEVNAGNRQTFCLNPKGVDNVIRKLRERENVVVNVKQLHNHWDATMLDWNNWHTLRMATGVGWDPVTQAFEADEDWWTAMAMRFKNCIKFKDGPLEHVEQLDRIFDGLSTAHNPAADAGGGGGAPVEHISVDPADYVGDDDIFSTPPSQHTSAAGPSRRPSRPSLEDVVQLLSEANKRVLQGDVETEVNTTVQALEELVALGMSEADPEFGQAAVVLTDPFQRGLIRHIKTLKGELNLIRSFWMAYYGGPSAGWTVPANYYQPAPFGGPSFHCPTFQGQHYHWRGSQGMPF